MQQFAECSEPTPKGLRQRNKGSERHPYIVQQQGTEELHDACILHGINVLRTSSSLGHGLYKLYAGLLVLLKNLQQRGSHVE